MKNTENDNSLCFWLAKHIKHIIDSRKININFSKESHKNIHAINYTL